MDDHVEGVEHPMEDVNDAKLPQDEGSTSTLIHQHENIRSTLYECLSTEWTGPDMACVESFTNPINPGLVVNAEPIDLTIGLPLSYREVDSILNFCEGLECPDDQKVRTAWTIPADLIEFSNPVFVKWLKTNAQKVSAHLRISRRGQSAGGRIVFTGLILQPPCASNESLRLITKQDNALVTMAVVLPTMHTGGKVQFSKNGTSMEHETSGASPFGCTVLSWLSGVEADLGSIESGCRVMLTYELVSVEKIQFPSERSTRMAKELLLSALLDFKKYPGASGKVPGVLTYVLKRNSMLQTDVYGELEDHAKDLVDVLKDLCAEIGIFFFLANISVKVTGERPDDENLEMVTYNSARLEQVFDLESTLLAQFVKIDEENILQKLSEGFDNGISDIETDGQVSVTYYSTAILLAVPRCYPALLLNPDNEPRFDASEWLSHSIYAAEEYRLDDDTRDQLLHGCRYITAEYNAFKEGTNPRMEPPFCRQEICLTIKASLFTGELNLSFGLEDLTCESYTDIGVFISTHGFPAVEKSLTIGLSKLPHVRARQFVLDELDINVQAAVSVESPVTKNLMVVWREQQAEQALQNCIFETSDDAHCLVLMAGRHGSEFLLSRILPPVRKHIWSPRFVLDFLNYLAPGLKEQRLCKDAVRFCYRTLLEDLMPSLWLRGGIEKSKMRLRNVGHACALKPSALDPTSEQIAEVITNCLEIGLSDSLDKVVRRLLVEEKTCVSTDDFETVYLPFLQHLLELLQELQSMKDKQRRLINNTPEYENVPIIKRLFQKLVQSHLRRLKSPNPPLPDNPTNWVKLKKGCNQGSCRDCRKLDRFLQDPSKRQAEFRVNSQRRRHLEERVRGQTRPSNSSNAVETNPADCEFRFRVLDNPYPGVLIIEKTFRDFQSEITAWSEKCDSALDKIDQELVSHGAAVVLGDVMELLDDLRELVRVKLLVTEACLDLILKESRWTNLSTGH